MDDNPAAHVEIVEVGDYTFIPVKRCGRMVLDLQQGGSIKTAQMNVAYVPSLSLK